MPPSSPASLPPSSEPGHTPPLHPAQGGPLPHWQTPPVEQLSDIVESHGLHVPPSVPHVVTVGMVHTPLAQHPPGQEVASQTQFWPEQR